MSNKINLEPTRLKASEFILGILVGIVISILIEGIFRVFTVDSSNIYWIVFACFILLGLLFFWYKRVIGFPDFMEFYCKFLMNKDFEWSELRSFFANRLEKNLKKQGYVALGVFIYRPRKIIQRIDFIEKKLKSIRLFIKRTRFWNTWGFIYIDKEKEKFRFLLGIPVLSHKSDGIIQALKDTIGELEKTGYIKKIKRKNKFTSKKYFYKSIWYPIIKKGKLIDKKLT